MAIYCIFLPYSKNKNGNPKETTVVSGVVAWTPNVCKILAFEAMFRGFGPFLQTVGVREVLTWLDQLLHG